jgi:hypothetical protein
LVQVESVPDCANDTGDDAEDHDTDLEVSQGLARPASPLFAGAAIVVGVVFASHG